MKTTLSHLALALPALAMSASAQANAPTLFSAFDSSLEGWTKVFRADHLDQPRGQRRQPSPFKLWRMTMNHRILIGAGLLALGASTAQAQIVSNFDSGLDGWTGTGGTVSHVVGGGNGGGYLSQRDTLNTWMSVSAPAAFLGNLSAYLGGVLSFDVKNINNHAANLSQGPWFGHVVITGAGGSASLDVVGTGSGLPLLDGQWHGYGATLDPASWSGDLAAALADTTAITLTLEFNNAITETAGLDNFQITAVPEPATALLMGAGVVAMVRRLRQRDTARRRA